MICIADNDCFSVFKHSIVTCVTLNSSRDTHSMNRMSFTRCQFENWCVITAYDCMVVHRDVYWNDITWSGKEDLVWFGLVWFYGISTFVGY